MKVDQCYQLGEVLKTHGLKGEVVIYLDSDKPERYSQMESMFLLQAGKLVPFFIQSIDVQGETARVKIEEVDSVDQASALLGLPVYLPLRMLEDSGDGYYYHELIGFVVKQGDTLLGKVTEIYDQERNPLFAFDHQGFEVLVPFQDKFITKVDKVTGQIQIDLPEGYLDIYTQP